MRKPLGFVVVSLALALALGSRAGAQTLIHTSSGPVQGFVSGAAPNQVTKWLAVPYGESTAGDQRWRRPIARAESPVTLDATLPGPACMQYVGQFSAQECRDLPGQTAGTLVGSEDCLSLSIYRPTADAPSGPRPVMVWIHGGAFVTGCAKDGLTEASDLALHGGEGQIVVAIQYRLGPLGFFALPELRDEDPDRSAGNYGLLDMLLALEWVQANIAAFGGDPDNVTIFGESAGGVATCALLASPLGVGLFERAVVESGNCAQSIPLELGPGAPPAPDSATGFGRGAALSANAALGCGDPATRLGCMRAKTTAELFAPWSQTTGGALGFPQASMAIDGHFASEQPIALLADGAAQGRGLLIGANANEMTVFTLTLNLPSAAAYEALVRQQAGDWVADFLLPIWPASAFPNPTAAYRRFAEDIGFVCPSFQAANLARRAGSDAHLYHFAYDPGGFLMLGSFHGLELFYLFGGYARLSSLAIPTDAGDAVLSEAMQAAWTSYARTGVPATAPAWPAFDGGPLHSASQGSAFVWNLSPANVLSSSVSQTALLRTNRCAQLEGLGPVLNADLDALTSDRDNCPSVTNSTQADHDRDAIGSACDVCAYTSDPFQEDRAGVAGGGPDGVGDACQCGDTDVDADVDGADLVLLRGALAGATPLTLSGSARCSVAGGDSSCDLLDAVVLGRRLAGESPELEPDCVPAQPRG